MIVSCLFDKIGLNVSDLDNCFRPIYALISGIIGGTITDNFVKNVKDEHIIVEKSSCSSGCCSSHSHSHNHVHTEKKGNKFTEFVKYAYGEFLDDLTPQLIVGIVLAGLISIIPDSIFTFVQGSYLLQLLVVLAIGIPLYVCATSSIPIALALIAKGLTPGAAFVFLVVGPATNVATITLITNALGKKIVGLYVGIIAITGVIGGLALDYLHKVVGFDLHSHMAHDGHGEDSIFLTALTVIFSIFFTVSVFKYVRNKINNIKGGGNQVKTQEVKIQTSDEMKFKVTSMTCNHCKGNITKALEKVAEIKSFDIDLASKIVTVKSSLTNDEIKQVIEGSGYPVD
jgi:copper chaperone CopZ